MKVKGINCVEKIDSSSFRVPVMKEDGYLEYVECRGLKKITEKHTPLDTEMHAATCGELEFSLEKCRGQSALTLERVGIYPVNYCKKVDELCM